MWAYAIRPYPFSDYSGKVDEVTRVAGLILAGGDSRRLGQPKQMQPYRDGTLLGHIIAEAEAVAELDPLVVVLPPDVTRVPDPTTQRALIVRRQQAEGCSSSVHAGLDALPQHIAAIAVLPGDQPDLRRELISLAARSWLSDRPLALTLSFRGKAGHPFIFSASLRDRLHALHGDKGMWRLLEELGNDVARVEVEMDLPRDVDTFEDYGRVLDR
jgi:molybdenum cofactor cytidylyltransferase